MKKNLKLLRELLTSGEKWMIECFRKDNKWTDEDIEESAEKIKHESIKQESRLFSFNPNYNNIGIGTVTAKECSGNNIDMLVHNINQIVQEGEELSAVSNFEFVDRYWRCIVLVRQLPQNMYNMHGVIEI